MFIPHSVGKLTGWKAVVGVIIIVGLMGGSAWLSFQPKVVAQGTWDLAPGEGRFAQLTATKSTQMKIECEPVAAMAGSDEAYAVFVVDEANARLLTSDKSDSSVQMMASLNGRGPLTIPRVNVTPGTICVGVENQGKGKLSVRYKVYEVTQR